MIHRLSVFFKLPLGVPFAERLHVGVDSGHDPPVLVMERQAPGTQVDASVIAEDAAGARLLTIQALGYFRSHEPYPLILPEMR